MNFNFLCHNDKNLSRKPDTRPVFILRDFTLTKNFYTKNIYRILIQLIENCAINLQNSIEITTGAFIINLV